MITREKLTHHIAHLRDKHDRVDEQIKEMEKTGHYTDEEIHQLKKQKLLIKDEIEKAKHQIEELA